MRNAQAGAQALAQADPLAQAQARADALAQVRAKAEAVQRNFKRLKLPYEQSLIKRPRLADLLMSRHLAVEQAIGVGLWEDAELALAAFETALRTPPSGEDALLNPEMSKAPKQVATGTPLSAEPTLLGTEEQRAADLNDQQKAQAQAAEVQLKLRRLKLPYDQALLKRPKLAVMLKSRYEAVQKAIAEGSWAATDALAKLDAALKTPPSGEAALLDEWMPKAAKTSVAGTPLTADATLLGTAEQAASDLKQEQAAQRRKAELEQMLQTLDAELLRDKLYDLALGGDLKLLKNQVGQQLNKRPLDWSHLDEAEALLKELRVKTEFIRKRDHKIGNRRRKLTDYSGALEFEPGRADALLKDKSLKAGGHFTDFAKALQAFEANGAPKETAALTKAIDSYLRHFEKFSDADKAKAENQTKRKAVIDVQTRLAARAMIAESKTMAAKGNWSREDESKATELYLNMMLLMAEAPPRNLKGEKAQEKVMAVKNVKGADKLVVKPVTGEIPVEGFVAGGGASREMLASVMGDKLQEMLGIELNVAVTKVVSIDGGKIGLEPGKAVTVSAQAFAKQALTMKESFEALMDQELKRRGLKSLEQLPGEVIDALKKDVVDRVPAEEVQNKAIFDLISMHCDRHLGNFMVGADNKLIPIDHGNILPTKAGIMARRAQMGAPHAVLATTPAAKQKLGADQIERIERLNTNELMKTMKDAQTEMRKATPDADKGDLDEGLNNSKRSIEFLKFACRTLTLEQIYGAYSRNAGDIFFIEEENKLAGFARAVNFVQSRAKVADALEAKMIEMNVSVWKGARQYGDLLPNLRKRGWFVSTADDAFVAWAEANPQKLLKVLDPNYPPPPQPNAVPSVATNVAMPDTFLGAAVKKVDWSNYQKVGGDDAWTRAGGKAKELLSERTRMLREYQEAGGDGAWAKMAKIAKTLGMQDAPVPDRTKLLIEGPVRVRYLELGGDAAWMDVGGDDTTPLPTRVKSLEALQCVANVPFD